MNKFIICTRSIFNYNLEFILVVYKKLTPKDLKEAEKEKQNETPREHENEEDVSLNETRRTVAQNEETDDDVGQENAADDDAGQVSQRKSTSGQADSDSDPTSTGPTVRSCKK